MLKYSLKDFLTQEIRLINSSDALTSVKINDIKIPMIQRDYAQGRLRSQSKEDAPLQLNTAGEKFISELFSYLIKPDPEKEKELDFIYGSIEEQSKEEQSKTVYFYPLDGQQRLTTLFLLYWYIGGAELEKQDREGLADILAHFYYATRTSANVFCEKLVDALSQDNIDFHLRKKATIVDKQETEPKINIVTQIENMSWFHDSYKLDPTVQAMLNMLDRIQELYIEMKCSGIYKNLEKLRFYILPLSNFGLTEELYVKMNARGKQLTNFENFKADFQGWVRNNAKALDLPSKSYGGRKMPYDMALANKMDNEWSAMFWEIQKKQENKNFDQRFLAFIYKYWLNAYVLADHAGKNIKDVAKEEQFAMLNREPVYEKFDIFAQQITDASFLVEFENTLDRLSENYADIDECIQPVWNDNYCLLTENKSSSTKAQAVFGAVILYLQQNAFDKQAFQKWMHVVWNIVENADFDHDHVLISVMQLLAELAPHSTDIYSYLAGDTFAVNSKQSPETINEERLKARLIIKNPDWIEQLSEAEAHPFFRGSVAFLIPDDEDIKRFKHNYEMAQIFFDKNGISEKYRGNNHIFLRALLSRYAALSDIKYCITDVSEKENSLKHRLSLHKVVREAIQEWFALSSEAEVEKRLLEETEKDSPILTGDNDFEKNLHEALYKRGELVTWMQQSGAIRYKESYIHKPSASAAGFYIYVYGYRNEIVDKLIQIGWESENQCYIDEGTVKRAIPYFWSREELVLKKQIVHNGQDLLLKCYVDKSTLSVKMNDTLVLTQNMLDGVKFAKDLPAFINLINTNINSFLSAL